jgi:hypothetical protein
MKSMVVLIGVVLAVINSFGQAPEGWQRVEESQSQKFAPDIVVRSVGSWIKRDTLRGVEVFEQAPIQRQESVREEIGGGLHALIQQGARPMFYEVLYTTKYPACRFHGIDTEGFPKDDYFIFAKSHTYILKSTAMIKGIDFSLDGWDFGEPPLGKEYRLIADTLEEINRKLDASGILLRPSVKTDSATAWQEIRSAHLLDAFDPTRTVPGSRPRNETELSNTMLIALGVPTAIIFLIFIIWMRRLVRGAFWSGKGT